MAQPKQVAKNTPIPSTFTLFLSAMIVVVALMVSLPVFAQQPLANSPQLPVSPANAVATPPANSEPIMSQFKKTVIFLETDCLTTSADGSQTVTPYLGTGFLVLHHDDRFPQIGGFNYLVTNRHVAYPGAENHSPCRVVDYKVRFNLRQPETNGTALSEAFSLGPNVPWSLSTDESADIAVTPFGVDENKFSFLTFPTSLFLTDGQAKQNRVVEGDSVVFTGLFVQFLGQVKLEPIVREGKIAMIPGEPIPTTLRSLGQVYLVDAHVFGGNSGSPILVNLAGQRDNGLIAGMNYKLLGLVSGYVQETSELNLQPVAGYAGTVVANSGIAIVVPAQQILDLLEAPKMQEMRQQVVANQATATSPLPIGR